MLLARLDDEQRCRLDEEFGEPYVVIEPDDEGTIFRQVEPLEPVGTLVVVAGRDTKPATIAELDQFGRRCEEAVLVMIGDARTAPARWRHRVLAQL